MIRLLLVFECLVALNLSAVHARSLSFLGKSVDDWRNALNSREASLRRSAAFALGRMGEDAREAVPDLVRRLHDDSDEKVRDMAASAIGDIARALKDGNAEAWQQSGGMLVQILKDDQSERVRRSAAYALGAFGPQAAGATEILKKALGDSSALVRQNAAWALGQMGTRAGNAVDGLCGCLRDKNSLVRRDAATALGSLGTAGVKAGRPLTELVKAGRPLIELVKSELDPVVKKTALDSLAGLAGPEQADSAKDLEPLLEEKDPEIRLPAAIVLARIGGESATRALPVLRSALKSPDAHTQELVTAALVNLGPNAKPAMFDLADTLNNDKNPVLVRRNAALAIAHIGAEAKPVVPALVKALKRSQPLEVRQFAAEALAQMKYPANEEAIPAILVAIQKDADPLVRQKCVWSLFALNTPEKFRDLGADKALEKLLDDKTKDADLVRYDAARKLANVLRDEAPDKTADVLLEMLRKTDLKVYNRTDAQVQGSGTEATAGRANVQANLGGDARYMAVEALSWLGKKAKSREEIVKAIRQAAKDPDAKLQKSAKEALKELGLD
jgi:HEAT repeat protein